MVSFWPWKGDDNSPASFEKALSQLADKIAKANIRLDSQRSTSRRFKVLWTLYTSFAYLLYSIILALVLGWRKWGLVEYTAVLGGPPLIYFVRLGITKAFDWKISNTQAYLDDLQKQQDTKLEKLKVATKYNSTQQLLEKYGGASNKGTPSKGTPKKKSAQNQTQPTPPGGRTGIAPPPTANIQRASTVMLPSTPIQGPRRTVTSPLNASGLSQSSGTVESPVSVPSPSSPNEPGFAPNAFPTAPQYVEQHRWYDRLMDVLLGEDETLPKNRLALICTHCRLVNGQAPPGVKDMEQVGKWRCGGCGGWNGEENEAKRIMKEMKEREKRDRDEGWSQVSRGDEKAVPESEEEVESPRSEPITKAPAQAIDDEDDEGDAGKSSGEEPTMSLRSGRRKGDGTAGN